MESKLAPSRALGRLFGIQHPIVLAPLAGGPSTPELVAAVSQAGGLGSLGAAYLEPAAIREAIATIRRLTDHPFAVNLFLPEPSLPSDSRVKEMQALLAPYRAELGIPEAPLPATWSIPFEEQLDAVIDARVPICSFVFGVPAPDTMRRLRQIGVVVIGTATHVEEARQLAAAGVDAIVAQGGEAGGHRGTFLGRAEDALIGTMALVPQVVDAVPVPVIAAGGIMDGRGVLAALALGACAAQLGTAFLACDEAGTDVASHLRYIRTGGHLMGFGRNPYVPKAQAAEQKAHDATHGPSRVRAYRTAEAARELLLGEHVEADAQPRSRRIRIEPPTSTQIRRPGKRGR